MTPRTYTQDRRAESTAETRRRVMDAAVEVYREQGVRRATLQAVANRADVSRGTIVNHFGSATGLLEAVLDRAVVEVDMPGAAILDGAIDSDDRIRRFIDAMLRFYDRTSSWWYVFGDEAIREVPALRAREEWFWRETGALQALALGDLAGDTVAMASITGLLQFQTLYAMQAAGLSFEEVIAEIGNMAVDIRRRRERQRTKGGES